MGRKKKKKPIKLKIKNETLHSVAAIFSILIGLLIMVSFSGQGVVLELVNNFLINELGLAMLFLPFIFFVSGLVLLRAEWEWSKPNVLLGGIILMLAAMIGLQTGDIGESTFNNLSQLFSPVGTYITSSCIALIGLLIIMQSSLVELIETLSKWREERKEKKLDSKVDKLKNKKKNGILKIGRGLSIPKLNTKGKGDQPFDINEHSLQDEGIGDDQTGTAVVLPNQENNLPIESNSGKGGALDGDGTLSPTNMPLVWDYPPLSLLSKNKGGEADRGDVNENAQIIEDTLESFGIRAEVKEVNYGPSVTQYGLRVTRGTKISKITSLSIDLAMALAAPTGQIRIEAPIAGRSLVGIEVPNNASAYVTLRTILGSSKLKNHPSKLACGLGIDVAGKPVLTDIKTMPHLLVAGSTGSGKSVCINSFLAQMLFRASPSELRLILVDPKRVELTGYNGVPHLLTPVIVEPKKVVSALKWAVNLMAKRYKQLEEVGVKNIDEYNELAGLAAMPNLLIVIDEMADIMLYAPGEVEESVTRIAQMARAVGIHLILSTQRPSVDVITGLIKANIPARVAFNVSSNTDSRVILDEPGAEKLLGKGDMLFLSPDEAKPKRIQGTFVSSQETNSLIDYLKSQGRKPQYEEDITKKFKANKVGGGIGTDEERDELFEKAIRVFANRGKASASLLQRRLSIGYNRAARILDQLYNAGLIGAHQGSKPREIKKEQIKTYLMKQQG
ncbi:MAG: DNA translocase FtsK [Patescibacteria group bacterium]|nr:DNA translocase FtsK [Patescibacteria group bacterium]